MNESIERIMYTHLTSRNSFACIEKYGIIAGVSAASAIEAIRSIVELITHNDPEHF